MKCGDCKYIKGRFCEYWYPCKTEPWINACDGFVERKKDKLSNADKKGESGMNEKFYLFVFWDDSIYEMKCGISLKDAVWEMAKYAGFANELMRKGLKGFDNEDVEGVIQFANHFSMGDIKKVFIIEKQIYGEKEE